jgi:hypothetical protein
MIVSDEDANLGIDYQHALQLYCPLVLQTVPAPERGRLAVLSVNHDTESVQVSASSGVARSCLV